MMRLPILHGCNRFSIIGLVAIGIAVTTGCFAESARAGEGGDEAELLQLARSLFRAVPKDMATPDFPVIPERVRLGHALFFDPRMSVDGTESCSRCHLPALSGTDGLPKSVGVHGQPVPRNAPTVLNAGLYFRQHWDGVFANVEEQAKVALLGPAFGNPDYPTAMARVKAIPGYAALFQQAFPDDANPISEDNWAKAIGAYERTLVSSSRFDEYLEGKPDALSAAERKGLKTFIDTGCVDCHSGRGVGGGGFEKFGVISDYWKATGSQDIDKGRFLLTKQPDDLYKFKVPGLRDVAMTPPYFHDGSVDTLPRAVRIMAKVQLDADLSDAEAGAIVTFLGSLTGPLPENFARAPMLPAAGFGAPAPPSSPR